MQELETGAVDTAALNLDQKEWQAFKEAVAQGDLYGMLKAWQPWWMTQDAAELRLNKHGQRLVQGTHH